MALRNQPYLPLYVQDFLTDEKLNECSASTQGVYIKIMCLLHKQDIYGKIYLKPKYNQNESKIKSFTALLKRQLPFDNTIIENAITELIEEKVLYIEGDFLCQKRMVKDGEISLARSGAGSIGGKVGRNSGTKRYYNEPGYLYLIYDLDDNQAFKIGISATPDKRIKGIIRKTGRPNLKFRNRWYVDDMGDIEQIVLDYYDDVRDGEWIYGEYDVMEIENKIKSLIKSKIKANSKQNTEIENEYDIEIENEFKGGMGGNLVLPFDELKIEILKSDKWIEDNAILFHTTPDNIRAKIETFLLEIKQKDEIYRPLREIKGYFINWYKKYHSQPIKTQPGTYHRPDPRKLPTEEDHLREKFI